MFSLRFTDLDTWTPEFRASGPAELVLRVLDTLAAYRRRPHAPWVLCVSLGRGYLPGRVAVSGPLPWDTPGDDLDGMAAGWWRAAAATPGSDC
jgi:hypothetical protein